MLNWKGEMPQVLTGGAGGVYGSGAQMPLIMPLDSSQRYTSKNDCHRGL